MNAALASYDIALEPPAVLLVQVHLLRMVRDVAVAAVAATLAESCGCVGTHALAEVRMAKTSSTHCEVAGGVRVRARRSIWSEDSTSFNAASFVPVPAGKALFLGRDHFCNLTDIPQAGNGTVVTEEEVTRDGAFAPS
eukprot:CAMPEP_0170628622 /NCGR_PEP_ID=MMETSP0224-20130122/32806_1 /TAXON_ID=285029 /ORGANISM="Togula jolla, Strain CCCM 725" /LENGTH=137 /DNA_ID=CAMNT_0010956107 /DNA_START=457 /DNA_END=869 /DNA_ORIENTATION=+